MHWCNLLAFDAATACRKVCFVIYVYALHVLRNCMSIQYAVSPSSGTDASSTSFWSLIASFKALLCKCIVHTRPEGNSYSNTMRDWLQLNISIRPCVHPTGWPQHPSAILPPKSQQFVTASFFMTHSLRIVFVRHHTMCPLSNQPACRSRWS
jgi:hypothetical protein